MSQALRRRRQQLTQEELLAAAEQLFADRGYETTSVADIAAAAGMTKGAVYSNFAGKEDLLLAVMRRRDRALLADLLAEASSGPVEELPSRLARLWRHSLDHDRARLRLGSEFRRYATLRREHGEALTRWQRDSHDQVADYLRQLSRATGISYSAPVDQIVSMLLALAAGLAEQVDTDPSVDVEAVMRRFLEMAISS